MSNGLMVEKKKKNRKKVEIRKWKELLQEGTLLRSKKNHGAKMNSLKSVTIL